ncbi:MAG: hypothetical protein ACTSQI_19550 [Candidatus Helarchaeota archaeon]
MELDSAILTNKEKNPFPTSAITKRGSKIRVFIGRKKEMEDIGRVFKKLSDEEGLFKMIILEGESGVGKSTLFKRIYDFISTNDYTDLKINKFNINIAWIEAPQDPKNFTFKYIYTHAIQGFSYPPADLGDVLVKRLVKHLFSEKILYRFKSQENKFIENCYSYLFNRNLEVCDFLSHDANSSEQGQSNYQMFLKIINRHKRQLGRYLKSHEIDYKFLYKFLETVNPDEDLADEAKDDIEAELMHDTNFLKSEEDYKKAFKNIINIYKWIYDEKNVAVVIGIDSFERYHYESYEYIFSFFLNLRNSDLKNLVLFCIGTDQFWNDFRKFLEERKSGEIQFQDMIGKDLSLRHLNLNNTIEIIRQYLDYYYKEIGQNLGANPIYPFDNKAIEYLYNNSGGNIRTVLIKIRDVWDQFVNSGRIPRIQGYFEAMKYFRSTDVVELSPAEIEILYNYFNDISHFSTHGGRSTQVEQGLVNMLQFFKDYYPQIAEVFNKSKEINVLGEKLRPDVFFILFGALGEKEQRRIEIQVKMYGAESFVKAPEASTSIKLLQNYETDYLYFLTSSPLNDQLKKRLRDFGQRVGGINPIKKTQMAYLTLLLPGYFETIFKRMPIIDDYTFIFKNIFTFPFEFFLEYMRLIPRNKDTSTLNLSLSEADLNQLTSKYFTPVAAPPPMVEPPILAPLVEGEIEDSIHPPQPIPIPNKESIETETTPLEIESEVEGDLVSLIPQEKKDIVLHIFVKMHNRVKRYRNRATLAWLKKELANDFSQDVIRNTWNWLKNSKFIDEIKTSIILNQNSETILKQFKKY